MNEGFGEESRDKGYTYGVTIRTVPSGPAADFTHLKVDQTKLVYIPGTSYYAQRKPCVTPAK